MKTTLLTPLALLSCLCFSSVAREPLTRYRTPVQIPDVPGYVTLKCDFHMHTVFSDGLVWPTVRSEEAWREGLDAIAITDHIEYHPHKVDVTNDLNRSFELASKTGKDLNLIVVQGSEITRSMPPGHLNAIFLTNSTPLDTEKWTNAVNVAAEQGAFIFWNHPGWDRQTTNGVVVWYQEHTDLLNAGKLHGIEVVNTRSYYPEAHRWAIEKKLTMLSNSDIHNPLNLDYEVHDGDHRPMTLVFAKERTAAALKEALFARRTAVYSGNRLIGDEQFLKPIFEKSVSADQEKVTLKGKKSVLVQISNSSEIDYELKLKSDPEGFSAPGKLVLLAGKTVLVELKPLKDEAAGGTPQTVEYAVSNLLVGPDTPLVASLPVKVVVSQKK